MSDVPDELSRAPRDPRERWSLPRPGSLPTVTDLDEVTTRVRADNPSPMTLDGTNTYLLGAPGSGEAVVVDPGPRDHAHLRAARRALTARDATAVLILVTHHHADHAAAAAGWSRRLGCGVAAARRDVAGEDGRVLDDGTVLERAGLTLTAVATPGHSGDHLSFRVGTGALLTGDHVLGRGTSVVAHPDGDLTAYLGSLRRTLELGPDVLYPGHGPALREDPSAVLRYYRDHRRFRLHQVLAALRDGPHTPRQLVERIYAGYDEAVLDAAEASTRAALEALAADGRVATVGGAGIGDGPVRLTDEETGS